jgi:hypothetical protein
VTTVWTALLIETGAALAGAGALAAWARRRFRYDFDRDYARVFGTEPSTQPSPGPSPELGRS